jgi:hypothetical protein
MKVHAIQTGTVRIRTAQVEGRGPRRKARTQCCAWMGSAHPWLTSASMAFLVRPLPLDLIPEQVGPFTASARFTPDGAIVAGL